MALQSVWSEDQNPSYRGFPLGVEPWLRLSQIDDFAPARSQADGDSEAWHGFLPLPSNFSAFEAAMRVASGFSSFAVVAGPSGWGKSHLLQVAVERASRLGAGECCVYSPHAAVLCASAHHRTLPLIVDGVQDIARQPRLRHRFMTLMRTRVRLKRPTLLALDSDAPSSLVAELSALGVERAVFNISFPSPWEREKVVESVSRSSRISLHPTLIRVIGRHVDGNARSMHGALNRLALYGEDWSREADLPRALGITLPFLTGRDGWDIRDAVQEAVVRSMPPLSCGTEARAWLSWSLRRLLKMPEDQVAAFIGASPGEVHRLTELARSWRNEAAKQRIKSHLIEVLSE